MADPAPNAAATLRRAHFLLGEAIVELHAVRPVFVDTFPRSAGPRRNRERMAAASHLVAEASAVLEGAGHGGGELWPTPTLPATSARLALLDMAWSDARVARLHAARREVEEALRTLGPDAMDGVVPAGARPPLHPGWWRLGALALLVTIVLGAGLVYELVEALSGAGAAAP